MRLLVPVIPGQVHAEHVPGSVGLPAEAAGVGEAVNVGLHVLLELALVVCKLAAHPAGPHPIGLHEDVLNLLVQLRIDLDEVLRHTLLIILRSDRLIIRLLLSCLFNLCRVLIFRHSLLQVSPGARSLELCHAAQAPGVLGQPPDLKLPCSGEELAELRLGDLDLAQVQEVQHQPHLVAGDTLEEDPGMDVVVSQGEYFTTSITLALIVFQIHLKVINQRIYL